MTNDLLKLAERVEAATGADPQIDAEIVAALNNALLKPYPPQTDFGPGQKWQFWSLDGRHFLGNEAKAPFKVLPVTASLDAAMTLVPEGWRVRDFGDWEDRWLLTLMNEDTMEMVEARSGRDLPALALTAAALRARAAS